MDNKYIFYKMEIIVKIVKHMSWFQISNTNFWLPALMASLIAAASWPSRQRSSFIWTKSCGNCYWLVSTLCWNSNCALRPRSKLSNSSACVFRRLITANSSNRLYNEIKKGLVKWFELTDKWWMNWMTRRHLHRIFRSVDLHVKNENSNAKKRNEL